CGERSRSPNGRTHLIPVFASLVAPRFLRADQASRRTVRSSAHPTRERGRLLNSRDPCSIARVLSEGRHRSSSSSRPKPLVLVVAAIVAVLLGAGGYFLLFGGPGGDGGLIGGQGGGQDNTVPPFDFAMGKAAAVSTNAMRDKKLKQAAARAAQAVVAPITTLYTEAFLDPGNWREGSYDELWAQFDAGAAEQAQTDASVLTLGTGAGDLYDTVQPGKGK